MENEKYVEDLRLIVDAVDQKHAQMVLTGEKNDYVDLVKKVPSAALYEWLSRPIKMDELAQVVGRHLTNQSKRILIVDDDPAYAKMLREWLKDEYKIFIVTDGAQVLNALYKNPVDLILLDYEMPIMDGPQVFHMLRANEDFGHIPVVLLTGVSDRELVAKVVELKPQGYILKSNTKDKLL